MNSSGRKDVASRVRERLLADKSGMTGAVLVLGFLLVSVLTWLGLAGQEWSATSGARWAAPSSENWFGTNLLGQDIFSRAIYSTRTAFEVGLLVAVSSTVLGALLGALAGWNAHRWPDGLILWVKGVLDSVPFYLFVAALAYAFRGNPFAMHIAMVLTFWTATSRLIRAEVMKLKASPFVRSARAIGLPDWRIVVRHVLPNTVHILLVQGTLVFVAAIKTEVILSFLGLGIRDGVSWGIMLAESTQEVIAGHFGNFLSASGFLFLFLLGLILLSDALQDALDPTLATTPGRGSAAS